MNQKLNKYVNPDGIDILQNLRILVQDPNNFNDPFEFSTGVDDLSPEEVLDYLNSSYAEKLYEKYRSNQGEMSFEEFKKKLIDDKKKVKKFSSELPDSMHDEFFNFKKWYGREKCGVICFASENIELDKEVLLWSHYTASHRGLRILFDISKIKVESQSLCEVDYVKNRLLLKPLSVKNDLNAADKIFIDLLSTKSTVWKYESEYRWLISYLECCKEYDGKGVGRYYAEIEPDAILRVDLGVNISDELKIAVVDIIKQAHFKDVDLFQAKLNRRNYALDFDLIKI